MVEATLVYPVILLICIFSVAVMMFLFERTEDAACLSMELRAQAGITEGTVYSSSEDAAHPLFHHDEGYSITETGILLLHCFRAEKTASIAEPVLSGFFLEQNTVYSHSSLCEAEILWQKRVAGEIIE